MDNFSFLIGYLKSGLFLLDNQVKLVTKEIYSHALQKCYSLQHYNDIVNIRIQFVLEENEEVVVEYFSSN